ncbi:2-keto-4-pentenoate hydratase [Streptomyces sp. NPDC057137]|uniref:2-keto-4-pentenoate hydratase n=1 Tax=Streptomyces sp. NPDC057137 TaxID=3346030 RepID=UPI0036393132
MQPPDPTVDTAATAPTLGELAALLERAEAARRPMAPLTELRPGLTVAEAYVVQETNTRLRLAAGDRLAGRKVGLTSAPMQRQMGVDEPDFGVLFRSMVVGDGGTIDSARLIAPRIEAEIAFVLGERLAGPAVSVGDARAAVSHVVAAIEVIDSRIRDWRLTLADTVADNASSALVITGPAIDADPALLTSLGSECLELTADGRSVAKGIGAEVLGDPLEAVAWLARTLHAYGVGIEPGELVLAGAVHASIPLTGTTTLSLRSDRLPTLTATVR